MPIYRLSHAPVFPPAHLAEESGLLAVGGDLTPERLLAAYRGGIFPWYSEGDPILWWSLDPRLILIPDELHVARSLAKAMRRGDFTIRFDTAFDAVVHQCGETRRHAEGTWITPEMASAYGELHRLGHAHSVEAWQTDADSGQETLVGGVYGVAIGGAFYGESMFHSVDNASKVAFAALAAHLRDRGFSLIDCQMTTPHMLRFGAREVPRAEFLRLLERATARHIPPGLWR
ncbi:leucyl/phenylalanyl-tRNA--protein transferase [Magnetofaba australis]|uniref:Leucyl/phenylalanyl-tRNA--protein transferase n=1 Tax=Magnetofaba australis IT-1 TaxID=1434232 RepID=A0A1Y2K829_9PROT|nr:leucyl/phenylalanyl-tRNA--protein transferase [Magnetofaba australis]OSM06888.1 putative leucyl/phenylalanyl-tRNA--protein transferase [Magnetofaba australis IT-1]